MLGTYTESRWGKEQFCEDIINPIVRQDGYLSAHYVYDSERKEEWVEIYALASKAEGKPIRVCVTADSCCAMLRDVLRKLEWEL